VFPAVSAAAFADAAWSWDEGYEGPLRVGSAGFGTFIGGGYYPALRWNWVWTTADYRHFAPRPRLQFTMTFDF
jgi:hypothetical protein